MLGDENKLITPPVMCTQGKNYLLLTVCLENCRNPVVKLEHDKVSFKGVGGAEKKDYGFSLILYKGIEPQKSVKHVTDKNIELFLKKKEEGLNWPRATKEKIKHPWLKVNFDECKNENDSEDNFADQQPKKSEEEVLGNERLAGKNEENSEVSKCSNTEKNIGSKSDTKETELQTHPQITLKCNYEEDQWSPFNPEGRRKYEREFLVSLNNGPQSIKKPENLPDVDVVLQNCFLLSDRNKPVKVKNKKRNKTLQPLESSCKEIQTDPIEIVLEDDSSGSDCCESATVENLLKHFDTDEGSSSGHSSSTQGIQVGVNNLLLVKSRFIFSGICKPTLKEKKVLPNKVVQGCQKSSVPIQGTNDSSSVSKHSMVQQGYYKDPYINHFVIKRSRRSPLINLGYYVRAVVIEKVLLEFIKTVQESAYQILSLGAGFDTSFFRLSGLPGSKNLTYFEIDLPDVVKRKASIIMTCNNLNSRLKNVKVDFSDCGLWSKKYRLLAADLRDLSAVKKALVTYHFDPKKPTLLLSECSITYMDEMSSRALIKFSEELLQDAVFITYEQICPDDGFGRVMTNHFKTINSPLLSLTSYPLLADQERRFIECGWQTCQAVTVWEAFINSTSEEERFRALRLEPFDEWEEWHLKCNHYTLVVAAKGLLQSWIPFPNFGKVSLPNYFVDPTHPWVLELHGHFGPKMRLLKNIGVKRLQQKEIAKMFGHCSVVCSFDDAQYIINVGGFGQLKHGSHERLKNISCFRDTKNVLDEISSFSTNNAGFDFMHHSCTVFDESETDREMTFILYGGRQSPLSCVNSDPKLVHCRVNKSLVIETVDLFDDQQILPKPEPRWRHSACIVDVNKTKLFLVFGGCSPELKVFDDLWAIDLNGNDHSERFWQLMPRFGTPPCGRFSHSVSVHEHSMYLSGGMNDKFEVLSDLWLFDARLRLWVELPVHSRIMPRYGHTSHIFKSKRKNLCMILIGGVSTQRETWPCIAFIDLVNLICFEYKFPCLEPLSSIMLQNHSSVLSKDKKSIYIIGGGGNCFSFGTKFNSFIIELPLSQWMTKAYYKTLKKSKELKN